MERISLTRKIERVLPVNINGQDIDLIFDVGNQVTRNEIIGMLDDIVQYEELGKALFAKAKDTTATKTVNEIRKFSMEGLELSRKLSEKFSEIFPDWKTIIGDNFIGLDVFTDLLKAMTEIIMAKETDDKVAEAIEGER